MPVVTCELCGASVERKLSQIKASASKRFFCSRGCYYTWQRQNPEKLALWNGGHATATCAFCGKEFQRRPAVVGRDGVRDFCSRECIYSWQSLNWRGENNPNGTGREVLCDTCGKPIYRKLSHLKKYQYHFCSGKCRGEYHARAFIGAGNPAWRGGYSQHYGNNWKLQRAKARERDGHTCQKCGVMWDELEQGLDVHHIRPFRVFLLENNGDVESASVEANRLDNLVCLCRPCHISAEYT